MALPTPQEGHSNLRSLRNRLFAALAPFHDAPVIHPISLASTATVAPGGMFCGLGTYECAAKMSGKWFESPRKRCAKSTDDRYYENKKERERRIYTAESLIHSPFFDKDIVLGPDGFEHLSRSARGGRTKREQIRRFILFPVAIRILKTATTLQAYRKKRMSVECPGTRRRRQGKALVQWWAFVALFVRQDIKVRVVVRKVGGGKPHFWSIVLYRKPNRQANRRRAAT